MTSIALTSPDTGTATLSDLSARLRHPLHRFAAWRRYRHYPSMRRARREALFTWSADVVRHNSVSR